MVWGVSKEKPKKPYKPTTLMPAEAGVASTWSSYFEAANRVKSGGALGVGFEFNNNEYCGVDLDTVRNPDTGEVSKQANEIIESLNSYTEISPSGYGFHIIVKADIILEYHKKKLSEPPIVIRLDENGKRKMPEIEIYNNKRYFTITGNIYGDRKPIETRTTELHTVYDKYLKPEPIERKPPKKPSVHKSVPLHKPDEEYLSVGLQKDQAFINLWNGNRPNGNESADDIGLINKLAYWCNGNEDLIENTFFQSPYYAQKDEAHIKKCDRRDYIPRTIKRAVNDLKSTARDTDGRYTEKRNTVSPGRVHLTPEPIQIRQDSGITFISPFETADTRRRYSWNDIGMGYIFADTFKNVSRYVPEAKSWYCYDGKVWRQDVGNMKVAQQAKDLTDYLLACAKYLDDDTVKEAWIKFVCKLIKKTARDTMLVDAASVYPVSIMEFDKNPYIFNCLNCTLDLKNFKMHPHRSSDLLSKLSNVIFDKDAKCERWDSFISEVMNGNADTAKFLQKALGYALTGDTSLECFFILYGALTRNGKGTSMETALYLLGDYGRTAQPETIAQRHNATGSNATEDIARLKGARFVNMSEPDKGLRLNAALVKQMTGGDTMTARYLHQNSFEFKPEFKLFINTNHLPKVADDSIFTSGRVKLIPFERHFEDSEQDKGLKAFFRKPENISGIFNWFIEGLKLLEAEGLEQPQAVTEATNEYRENSDTIGLFIKDCLTTCTNNCIKIQQVYSEYSQWCDDFGYGAKNKSNFIEELNRKGLYKRHRTLGYVVYDYMLNKEFPFTDG